MLVNAARGLLALTAPDDTTAIPSGDRQLCVYDPPLTAELVQGDL